MLNKNAGHEAPQAVLEQICKNCANSESTMFSDLIRCKRDKSSVARAADGSCIFFKEKEETNDFYKKR